MYNFTFTKKAKAGFEKIEQKFQGRILEKIRELKKSSNVFHHLKPVKNLEPATHRLRIGNYRALLMADGEEVLIFKVGHRSEIYK